MKDRFSLTDQVAIITGASRGIGQAIAAAFAEAGAKVVVSSRKLENVAPVADEIRAQGGAALAVAAHTGKVDEVAHLVAETQRAFGRVDILVNNAATNPHFGQALDASLEAFDKIMEVNLRGYFLMCQQVVPLMREQGGGSIINLASVAGFSPMTGLGLYAISKAGVLMLTKVLAKELAQYKIRVNAIAPGIVKTKFSRVLYETPGIADMIIEKTPLARFGQVDDIVGAALYFAAPASAYTTGAVLVIDGGLSISGV